MAMLRAAHYDETVKRLVENPVVKALADGLPAGFTVPRDERHAFTMAANREFYERGGDEVDREVDPDGSRHIGGVVEALRELRPEVFAEWGEA